MQSSANTRRFPIRGGICIDVSIKISYGSDIERKKKERNCILLSRVDFESISM